MCQYCEKVTQTQIRKVMKEIEIEHEVKKVENPEFRLGPCKVTWGNVTCFECGQKIKVCTCAMCAETETTCTWCWDPYNYDGDCIAIK